MSKRLKAISTLTRQDVLEAMDNALEGIIIYDSQLRVIYANEEAERILKRTTRGMEPMRGVPVEPTQLKYLDGRVPKSHELTGHRAVAERVPVQGPPLGIKTLDHEDWVWVNDSAAPFLDDAGNVVGAVWMISDITGRIHAEREIQIRDRLREDMIQNLVHEFNTRLNLLNGYASMLASGEMGDLDGPQSQAARSIERAALSLSEIVSQNAALLSRADVLQKKNLKPINLSLVVRMSVTQMLDAATKANVELAYDVHPDLYVMGDGGLLSQAVRCAIDNAIKFNVHNGNVLVTLKITSPFVMLDIQDTGIGIDEKDIPHIWGRFRQVDMSARRKHDGLGIGLAVIKGVMAHHGVRSSLKSEVGVGTSLSFFFQPAEEGG